MKIRCAGGSSRIVAALGATPVAMPQNEAYDALQKGVVDGLVCPIETLKGWKFTEVVKHTTRNIGSSYSLGFFVAMNRQKWDSLPDGGPGGGTRRSTASSSTAPARRGTTLTRPAPSSPSAKA